jgi:hypothetical protein
MTAKMTVRSHVVARNLRTPGVRASAAIYPRTIPTRTLNKTIKMLDTFDHTGGGWQSQSRKLASIISDVFKVPYIYDSYYSQKVYARTDWVPLDAAAQTRIFELVTASRVCATKADAPNYQSECELRRELGEVRQCSDDIFPRAVYSHSRAMMPAIAAAIVEEWAAMPLAQERKHKAIAALLQGDPIHFDHEQEYR